MQSIHSDVETVVTGLEDVLQLAGMREQVGSLLDEAQADLDSWEERKKAAMSELNARFGQERGQLRAQMVHVLAEYALELSKQLNLSDEETAARLYYEFPTVPTIVLGSLFGLHPNKIVGLANRHDWPLGGACRACDKPYVTSNRAQAAAPWTPPAFCGNCRPRCSECNVHFNLENETDDMLDRLADGETFRCIACADREECEKGIEQIESLAGEPLFDVSRERAHQLYGLSKDDFRDAVSGTLEHYDPEREDSNACALFTYKLDNRLEQHGVSPAAPKRKCYARTSRSSGARGWEGSYDSYIQSDLWRSKREWALERADHRCQLCSKRRDERVLHVHHNSYAHLGTELPADLIVLCDECHYTFHSRSRSRSKVT